MTLVIGCGNSDRGDDAAGILVVQRLCRLGIEAIEHTGDGLALIDLWNSDDDVILVDAMASGSTPGTVSVWDPVAQPLCWEKYRGSTHMFGPAEAIELARALDRLPRRIQIYGIEASTFELGASASREVLAAVDRVVDAIALKYSCATSAI